MTGGRDHYFVSSSEVRQMIEEALAEERKHLFNAVLGLVKDIDKRLKAAEKEIEILKQGDDKNEERREKAGRD